MRDQLDMVRMLISAQTLVTVFLAVLLWSLYTRLHRQEFNRWWASAWTLAALQLAMGALWMRLPLEWSLAKGAVMLLAIAVGFLVAPALVFGAMSFRAPGTITRRVALSGVTVALVLAVICFVASRPWAAEQVDSFAVRNGVRMLALATALFFCARVFIGRFRATRSWAALVTAVSCLVYGIDQLVYTAAAVIHMLVPAARGTDVSPGILLASARLMYLDIWLTCGICLGMVLLLLEEYQRSDRALAESVSRRRDAAEENSALQQEIRRRQEVEQRLVASEDRYRDLVEHSEDLVCIHDLDGRLLSVNPAPARILGYEVKEMLAMSVRDFLATDVQDLYDDYVRTLRRDGVVSGLAKVVTRQGEWRLWAFRNTLRTDGVATPIVRGMARDVTEQYHAERALRSSEEKFAIAFRSSPSAKAIISAADDSFIDVNTAFEAQTGYDRAELVHRGPVELDMFFDPSDHAALRTALAGEGRMAPCEMRFRRKDESFGIGVFSAEVVQVGGERCVLLAGLDVTARKDAEARHRAILRALPDWVFLTSPDGDFLEFHAKDRRHLLLPPSEFIGRNVRDVLPPSLASQLVACYHEAVDSGQMATMEYSLWVGDENRFYETRSVEMDPGQVLSLVRDVTDQRRADQRALDLQAELAHAGRVMALGTLTGSLAHEINQPLAATRANAYAALRLLESSPPDLGEVRDALLDIMSDNQRIDEVLLRMRGLLRKERREYAPIDVNAIVDDVLKLVHSNLIERRISIGVELGADLPSVLGDRVQLQQVVLNILMNAADAVSAAEHADDRRVIVTTAASGARVSVAVADRGGGVTDVELDRMFDPFFTTKADGMGLGLSISRTIMDAHGGQISARRNSDRGLTCSFVLDATAASHPVTPVGRPGVAVGIDA
jgi:PAS domain S-box-containing protein